MISPLAVVDPEAKIGKNVTIHPFAYIEKDVVIGDNNVILPYASILNGARIGNGNTIYQGAVIAAIPQDFNFRGEATIAEIGDNNTIREYAVISRATSSTGVTRVGNSSFIMQSVRLSHDVKVGDHCIIGNGSQLSGNVVVEDHAILSSCVLAQLGARVGQWALIQAGCSFAKDIPPYVIVTREPVTAYHSVNTMVLSNQGFEERIIKHIAQAYRVVYKGNFSTLDAADKVEQQVPMSEEIQNIIDFIRSTQRGILK